LDRSHLETKAGAVHPPLPDRLPAAEARSLLLSRRKLELQHIGSFALQFALAIVTSSSAIAVLFIFYFIARDALPFFQMRGLREFFLSAQWYPSHTTPAFGAFAIFAGTGLVTIGAIFVAVPLGVSAAICLSDIIPFKLRQFVKPIIEILAAIPSVAYGFFALVVLAPLLQDHGGPVLAITFVVLGAVTSAVIVAVLSEIAAARVPSSLRRPVQILVAIVLCSPAFIAVFNVYQALSAIQVSSGTNALNVSLILGIMALPTVVSVSEDALQAVGRELREGSYACGATRAETILRVVLPAAGSGICAAVILGIMRAIGETMVVWMASGNAAQIPTPWYNFLQPVRTLTATIAGDMGEADHVTGSERYHVLFAMALCLLVISFLLNTVSEWAVRRTQRKLQGR